MITLFTGKTGHGKTALVVDKLSQIKDRPIFVMGIPELKVDHFPVPPISEWTEQRPDENDPTVLLPYFTFPPRALLVIDEAQRIYRPRASGSRVPDIVAALETHRHTGIDIWLVTQDPGLIDTSCRRHVVQHFHIRATAFGRYLLEWAEMGDPEAKSSREIAKQNRYKPPPRAFKLYKSAEAHTKVKIGLPFYFYVFIFATLALIGGGYYTYHRISSKLDPVPEKTGESGRIDQMIQPGGKAGKPPSAAPVKLTAMEYVDQFEPRLQGMPHTASAYDHLTTPQQVPEISGCWTFREKCSCRDQQGANYPTTDAICLRYVHGQKQFQHWKREPARQAGGEPASRPAVMPENGNSAVALKPTAPVSPLALN